MKHSLVCTATRNEGPFLLEWIAWQKMLGFDRVLTLHNDCTDHSPQLLQLLKKAGEIGTRKHDPAQSGLHPQPSAYKAMRSHPFVKQAEWAFICDVDEFLVIHKGSGTVSDLLDKGDLPCQGMAVNWRIFGSDGAQVWRDEPVHRRFTRSAPSSANQNHWVKSFIRHPLVFAQLRTHTPRFWQGTGRWGAGENHWRLSDGSRWDEYDPDKNYLRGTARGQITHAIAELNHYLVQSREQFDFRKGSGSASDGSDRYTEAFRQRFDHNAEENHGAMAYAARFDAEYARLAAIPGVMRLHHLCCADYVAALCNARGAAPESDQRWIDHMAQAKTASAL